MVNRPTELIKKHPTHKSGREVVNDFGKAQGAAAQEETNQAANVD